MLAFGSLSPVNKMSGKRSVLRRCVRAVQQSAPGSLLLLLPLPPCAQECVGKGVIFRLVLSCARFMGLQRTPPGPQLTIPLSSLFQHSLLHLQMREDTDTLFYASSPILGPFSVTKETQLGVT